MNKIILLFFFFSFSKVFSQEINHNSSLISDTVIKDSEIYLKAKLVGFDTLSYSEEYRRDKWNINFGIRGGIMRGKYKINEGLVDQVSASGSPVLDANGRASKNNFINNSTFETGYTGGIFGRFTRGSFYLQPELIYSQKAGKIDLLNNDGSLNKRISGKISSIDIPLLLGIRFRDARVFFGPTSTFAFNMNKELKDNLKKFTNEKNLSGDFFIRPIFNFNVGMGFEFGDIFFEVKYEKGLRTYASTVLGPSNSPKIFNIYSDGIYFSVGLLNK